MDSPSLDSEQCMLCFVWFTIFVIVFICFVFICFWFVVIVIVIVTVEMCILTKDSKDNVKYHQLGSDELNTKIKEYEEAHKDDKKEDD